MRRANGLKRTALAGLTVLGSWTFFACQEDITATLDGDLIPVGAVTVEVTLPFQDFAGDLEHWGGYGQAYQLPNDVVARAFEGSLDARILNNWFPYPRLASVRDSA